MPPFALLDFLRTAAKWRVTMPDLTLNVISAARVQLIINRSANDRRLQHLRDLLATSPTRNREP